MTATWPYKATSNRLNEQEITTIYVQNEKPLGAALQTPVFLYSTNGFA